MSDVRSDRCRNTQGFLTKNVKEIFWDLNFLSEVTGCRKTQVSERTGSTVLFFLPVHFDEFLCSQPLFIVAQYLGIF